MEDSYKSILTILMVSPSCLILLKQITTNFKNVNFVDTIYQTQRNETFIYFLYSLMGKKVTLTDKFGIQ